MDTQQPTDLRSDTVTVPTPGMREAMMQAQVGDDVFGEDEAVNALQAKAAELFGMEAGLFCPTGTMANQIGIKVHTQPGDEVICHELSHIYVYEGGGIAVNSGASVRLMTGEHGRFTAEQVRASVNRRNDSHFPWTRLVAIENTVNKGGGGCWNLQEIQRIRAACDEHQLALHLDGARLFNALVARRESPKSYGKLFHTISICLSKGLGTPLGSVLLGSKPLIAKAHRWRKLMGGGMRQAGFMAAAGSYALDHHVERLAEDHLKAAAVARELGELAYVAQVLPVETNIVIFALQDTVSTDRFLEYLGKNRIKAFCIAPQTIRFVFHLDVNDAQTDALRAALRAFH